jgi:AcrR family transcriptional regulator
MNRPRTKSRGRTESRSPSSRSPRRRILEAARAHFFKHGFRNVTMDDLAAELAVSKKTLYVHFPSKEALLKAVLRDKFERIRATLEQVAPGPAVHFPSALHDLLRGLQGELEELQPPFLRDMRKAPEAFKHLEQRRARLIRDRFGRLFRHGQREGHVRTDVPARLMIETLLASVQAIMNPPKLAELGMTPRSAFTGLIDLLLHGAVIRKRGRR